MKKLLGREMWAPCQKVQERLRGRKTIVHRTAEWPPKIQPNSIHSFLSTPFAFLRFLRGSQMPILHLPLRVAGNSSPATTSRSRTTPPVYTQTDLPEQIKHGTKKIQSFHYTTNKDPISERKVPLERLFTRVNCYFFICLKKLSIKCRPLKIPYQRCAQWRLNLILQLGLIDARVTLESLFCPHLFLTHVNLFS